MTTKHPALLVRRLLVGAIALATAATTLTIVAAPAQADTPPKPARTWGTNGRVNYILPVGNQVFVGGEFTAVIDTSGGSHAVSNIAVFNATTGAFDLGWQGSANGLVNALAADPTAGVVYIGGLFSKADGVNASRVAALSMADGTIDPNFNAGADAQVDGLATANGSLFMSGLFSTVTDGSGSHARPFIAKLNGDTGTVDMGWTVTPNARTRALSVTPDGSQLFFAGDFKKVNAIGTVKSVGEVSTATPAVLSGFRPTATNGTAFSPVVDVTNDGTAVYVAATGSGGACTGMNSTTGARLFSKHGNGDMQSVKVVNGVVWCGGHYGGTNGFDGLVRYKIAAVSATAPYSTLAFAPFVDSALGVWALGADATHLYLGGDFDNVGGVVTPRFAEFIDTTVQTPPTAPVLTATPGDAVVHLAWSPPSTDGGQTIKSYVVSRRLSGVGSYVKIATVRGPVSYDDTAVTNGTAYDYTVLATNALGNGPGSNEVTATPTQFVQSPPTAPQNLTVTGGTGQVALSWAAPASNGNSPITGYTVYRGTATGGETAYQTLSGTTLSYTDTTITAGTTYFYYVTATNAFGEGGASSELSATPTAGVPGPTTLTATTGPGVVHLSWTLAAYDGGSPVTKYVVVRDTIRLVTLSGVNTLSYDDTAVTSGSTHTYQIRAVNSVGSGGFSNKQTVTLP
jgi:fibronectin type 3 domain-containing protein